MDLHRQVLASTERAAHAGQGDPDLGLRKPQRLGDLVLVDMERLGGDVQVDAPVLRRDGEARFRSEERLVLHADLVLAVDHDRRSGLRAPALDAEMAQHVPVAATPRIGDDVVHARRAVFRGGPCVDHRG